MRHTQRALFDASPAPPAVPGRTVLEFFAGIGLARIGFERAGWEVVFANDLDPTKRRLYEGHFGPAAHLCGDDVHCLADRQEAIPTATLAHASFPCTDLSLAGARRGIHAGQSSAFWGFAAVLDALGPRRPPLVLIENVTGLLNSHNGDDFASMCHALADLGYWLDPLVVDAAHFAPQSRPRLFVVGCLEEGMSLPTLDPLAAEPSPLRPAKLLEAVRGAPELPWRLADLPALPAYGSHRLEDALQDPPEGSPDWWSPERAAYLLSQMSPRHRAEADRMIAGRRHSYGAVFRRVRNGKSMAELRTDGLAGCLRTPKGGSGRQIIFRGGRGGYAVRLLSPAECARLMGAPGYRVTGPLNQALFGFGDGVSADVVAWIAEHYLNPLADRLNPVADRLNPLADGLAAPRVGAGRR